MSSIPEQLKKMLSPDPQRQLTVRYVESRLIFSLVQHPPLESPGVPRRVVSVELSDITFANAVDPADITLFVLERLHARLQGTAVEPVNKKRRQRNARAGAIARQQKPS